MSQSDNEKWDAMLIAGGAFETNLAEKAKKFNVPAAKLALWWDMFFHPEKYLPVEGENTDQDGSNT